MAAGIDATVATREDNALVLKPENFSPTPFTSITPVLAPITGQVDNAGNAVYVTGPAISYANLSAELVRWQPGLDQVSDGTFKFTINGDVNNDTTVHTLTLKINPTVNDSPVLGTEIVNNGAFNGNNGDAVPFPGWNLKTDGRNIGHSYGGVGFNTGDSPPTGIMQQVMSTVPGVLYTVKFQLTYGGYYTTDEQLTISMTDGVPTTGNTFGPLPGTSLFSGIYGQQAGTVTVTFTAQSTQTTLRIEDTTLNGTTVSTDIALAYIHAFGGPPPQHLFEDTSATFSTATLDGFAGGDPDGEVTPYTLTAQVTHGILTLASTSGLTITGTPANYTITGPLSAINQAMQGLVYTPSPNFNGTDALDITLNDNGSNGLSGVCPTYPHTPSPQYCDLTAALTIPLTIDPVNDAPEGTDKLDIAVAKNTPYIFSSSDFGFSDPIDAAFGPAANAFLAIKISSLPTTGMLTLAGAPVAAGQAIPVGSIPQLAWTPALNSSGAAIASMQFQVQDDGGTANGGIDLDPAPNTITFNVSATDPTNPTNPTGTATPVPLGGPGALALLVGLLFALVLWEQGQNRAPKPRD